MDTTTPPAPAEDRRKASRLRVLTAAAAVTGVAATAGLGLVIATQPPGTRSASSAVAGAATAAPGASIAPLTEPGTAGTNPSRPGHRAPGPGAPGFQPPTGASGPGRATTGGS